MKLIDMGFYKLCVQFRDAVKELLFGPSVPMESEDIVVWGLYDSLLESLKSFLILLDTDLIESSKVISRTVFEISSQALFLVTRSEADQHALTDTFILY